MANQSFIDGTAPELSADISSTQDVDMTIGHAACSTGADASLEGDLSHVNSVSESNSPTNQALDQAGSVPEKTYIPHEFVIDDLVFQCVVSRPS